MSLTWESAPVITTTVRCQDCGDTHEAVFDHLGTDGERIYAVVCGRFIEMYRECVVEGL